MKKLLFLLLMLINLALFSQSTVYDKQFITTQTLAPNNTLIIRDNYGNTVEKVVPNNNNGYNVQDNYGNRIQQILPNNQGGWDIKDNYGNLLYKAK